MSKKITSYFARAPINKKQKVEEPSSLGSVADTSTISDENSENEINVANTNSAQSPDPKRKQAMPLSPEQKERIQSNKLCAQLIKMSKELPIVSPTIGKTWFEALKPEFSKPYFARLSKFVTEERAKSTVFPTQTDVWSWTTKTSIQDVRVVILGQDPYHGPGQAHGLCFSVKPGVPAPPSLANMYKELCTDIPGFVRPNHGHLTGWAEQGVLLLNAVLTVTSGRANSHKDQGWEKLTDAVIRWISANCTDVVFLLWGAHAQKKAAFVDKSRHHVLNTTHPSPLSAHRGFLGCRHFSTCNQLLEKNGRKPIDWAHLPQ